MRVKWKNPKSSAFTSKDQCLCFWIHFSFFSLLPKTNWIGSKHRGHSTIHTHTNIYKTYLSAFMSSLWFILVYRQESTLFFCPHLFNVMKLNDVDAPLIIKQQGAASASHEVTTCEWTVYQEFNQIFFQCVNVSGLTCIISKVKKEFVTTPLCVVSLVWDQNEKKNLQ